MSTQPEYSDEFIFMHRFRSGSLDAFRYFYDTHYHPLKHYASRFINDADQAEDILAESFVVIWEKRNEFEFFRGITAYLYTCVRNRCLNHLRTRKAHKASHSEIAYLSDEMDYGESAECVRADLIQHSLIEAQQLPPAMKKVFHLLYVEGFSVSQAAKELRLSINTIRNQKATALKKVRKRLSEKGILSWILLHFFIYL